MPPSALASSRTRSRALLIFGVRRVVREPLPLGRPGSLSSVSPETSSTPPITALVEAP